MEIENSFNLEAEKICLSHLMTCGEFELLDLKEDDFFLETHRIVFQVIFALYDMGREYKFIDVIDFLENHKANKLKEPKKLLLS
jgi:replicative DNA helicase